MSSQLGMMCAVLVLALLTITTLFQSTASAFPAPVSDNESPSMLWVKRWLENKSSLAGNFRKRGFSQLAGNFKKRQMSQLAGNFKKRAYESWLTNEDGAGSDLANLNDLPRLSANFPLSRYIFANGVQADEPIANSGYYS